MRPFKHLIRVMSGQKDIRFALLRCFLSKRRCFLDGFTYPSDQAGRFVGKNSPPAATTNHDKSSSSSSSSSSSYSSSTSSLSTSSSSAASSPDVPCHRLVLQASPAWMPTAGDPTGLKKAPESNHYSNTMTMTMRSSYDPFTWPMFSWGRTGAGEGWLAIATGTWVFYQICNNNCKKNEDIVSSTDIENAQSGTDGWDWVDERAQ